MRVATTHRRAQRPQKGQPNGRAGEPGGLERGIVVSVGRGPPIYALSHALASLEIMPLRSRSGSGERLLGSEGSATHDPTPCLLKHHTAAMVEPSRSVIAIGQASSFRRASTLTLRMALKVIARSAGVASALRRSCACAAGRIPFGARLIALPRCAPHDSRAAGSANARAAARHRTGSRRPCREGWR